MDLFTHSYRVIKYHSYLGYISLNIFSSVLHCLKQNTTLSKVSKKQKKFAKSCLFLELN